jgi:PhnB protein
MTFYSEVLGGDVSIMQTFADSPVPVPDELGSRIFNSEIRAENLVLKASDDLPSHSVSIGANISLYVHFSDEAERQRVFDTFADGGKVLFPIEGNFGMVEDKYEIRWMLVWQE